MAGRSTVKITTELTGPFWRRGGELAQAMRGTVNETASETESLWRGRLGAVLKNPTGSYASALHSTRQGDSSGAFATITDGGHNYGGWLESGSKTSRFRGYQAARWAKRKVASMLRKAAKAKVAAALSALGGTGSGD